MKPITLTLCGWGPYKDKQEVDFEKCSEQGLFLVTGSTGAGKTTLFDAISYALFGEVSGEIRESDSVRSDFSGEETPTYVELHLSHAGTEYRIVRNPEYLRRKKRKTGVSAYTKEKENAILYLPDGKTVEGSKEVTQQMQGILRMDYGQFKQITMIAQGEFIKLLTAKSSEKTQIFRKLFSTAIYEQFADILKKRAAQLYDEVISCRRRMQDAVWQLSLQEEEWQELKNRESYPYPAMAIYLKEELQRKQAEKAVQNEAVRQLTEQLEQLSAQLENARHQNQALAEKENAERAFELLEEQEKQILPLRLEWEQAKRAQEIEIHYVNRKNAIQKYQELMEQAEGIEQESALLEEESLELSYFHQHKEELRSFAENWERLGECLAEVSQQEKRLREREEAFQKSLQEYKQSEAVKMQKKQIYEHADMQYKRAVVGLAARLLEEGKPCPVCGAIEHPHPAKISEDLPDEEMLERLKQEYEEAERQLLIIHTDTVRLKGEQEASQQELVKRQEQAAGIRKLLHEMQPDRQVSSELLGMESSELLLLEPMAIQQRGKAVLQQLTVKWERQQEVSQLLHSKKEIGQRIQREKKDVGQQMEQMTSSFTAVLKENGFAGEAAFEAGRRSVESVREMEEQIQAFFQKQAAARDYVNRTREAVQGLEKIDLCSLQSRQEELFARRDSLQSLCYRLQTEETEISRIHGLLRRLLAEAEQYEKQYGVVGDLDKLTSGNNAKRLIFEQYILAGYFDEILQAANRRLVKMTSGRYVLSRLEGVSDGRMKDSLEMQVFDYYTGKSRSVKTLSGGETFKTSLALALGMSDVIQAANGGIIVEALFVDEGFGSLDNESLDLACEMLQSLAEKDRMIGIVSHVPELRERIDCQIIVEKANCGSTIRMVY